MYNIPSFSPNAFWLGSKVASRRKTFAFVAVSVTVLSLLMTLVGSGVVAAPPDTVTICHATGSNSNPYVIHNPAKSGDVSGHDGHNGPVWFSGITETWGDIIPPFDYEGGSYPGKNWTEAGQAFYNNSCNIPAPPPVESTLTLEKIIDGGGATLDGFVPLIVGYDGEVTWGVPVTLDPDDYTVDELALVDDYEAGEWGGDCAPDGTVTLGEGENLTCTITNTFVPEPTYSLWGYKYNWDTEDDLLSGWTIELYDENEELLDIDVTDGGYYAFEDLLAGDYFICEVTQDAEGGVWVQMSPDGCYSVTLPDDGEGGPYDFWNQFIGDEIPTFSISGFKFDQSEEGLAGWTTFLDENGNSQLDEGEAWTVTINDGYFEFTNLLADEYTVCEVQQE